MSALTEYDDALLICRQHTDPVVLSIPYDGSATDYGYLKSYVVREAARYFGVDPHTFDTSTVLATTLIRDFVHKLTYFHETLEPFTALQAAGEALPLEFDVAPLLRHEAWALCGEISWQLLHVYSALGYECRAVNTLNGSLDTFDDGHVFVEVRNAATGEFLIQDPTYNVAHVSSTGELLNLQELRAIALGTTPGIISTPEGGMVYTYYSATHVVESTLGEPYSSFVTEDAIKTPWRVWTSDGIYACLSDFRDADKAGVQDASDLIQLVMLAKGTGSSFEQAVGLLAASYDMVGIGFIESGASSDQSQLIVARLAGGGDITLDFNTLQTVDGGVETHWVDMMAGKSTGGIDGADYSLAYRLFGADGLVGDFRLEDVGSLPSHSSPLDFSYVSGEQHLAVTLQGSDVIATSSDFLEKEIWSTWAESRDLLTGTLKSIQTWNDDGTSYRAQWNDTTSSAWVMKERLYDTSGNLLTERSVNAEGNAYQAWWSYAAADSWTLKEESSNSAGQLVSSKTAFADGTLYQAWWDAEDLAGWAMKEQNTGTAGSITTARTTNDDGSAYQAWWDVDNLNAWSITEQCFTAAGQTITSKATNDDGSSYQAWWNVEVLGTWATRELSTDTAGRLTTTKITNADGSTYQAWWDAGNSAAWSTKEQNTDTAGRIITTKTTSDDGSTYQAWSDVGNSAAWSTKEQNTDTAGRIIITKTTNDDGSTYQAWSDADNSAAWSTKELNTDTAGRIITTKTTNDDGSTYQAWSDAGNSAAWSTEEQNTDIAGRITTARTTNDDGSAYQAWWDAGNNAAWLVIEQSTDAAGQVTTTKTTNDNGSAYQAWWDVTNTEVWSFMEKTFDTDGHLLTQRIVNDDGTVSTLDMQGGAASAAVPDASSAANAPAPDPDGTRRAILVHSSESHDAGVPLDGMVSGVLEFHFADEGPTAALEHITTLQGNSPGGNTGPNNDQPGQAWLSTQDIFGDDGGALPLPVSPSDAQSVMVADAPSQTAASDPATEIDLAFMLDTAHATAILRALQHADTALTS